MVDENSWVAKGLVSWNIRPVGLWTHSGQRKSRMDYDVKRNWRCLEVLQLSLCLCLICLSNAFC